MRTVRPHVYRNNAAEQILLQETQIPRRATPLAIKESQENHLNYTLHGLHRSTSTNYFPWTKKPTIQKTINLKEKKDEN